MADRKFNVADIVRCSAEGEQKSVAGHGYDKLEVVSCQEDGYWDDGDRHTIRFKPVGEQYVLGRWRERWYELVSPAEGPW